MVDTAPTSTQSQLLAQQRAQELQRLKQIQAQQAAQQAASADAAERAAEAARSAPLAEDVFVRDAQIEGTSEQQRTELYERFNTDGEDGLSDAEFDALYNEAVPAEEAPATTYEVKPGDSLSQIAAQYGKSWEDLYQHGNNAQTIGSDPNLIHPGQQLEIPAEWTQPADPEGGGVPAEEVQAAKDAIDGAGEINPDRPTGGSPDRIDEQRQRDVQTMQDAQAALEQIPADDPQRAQYEQKVADITQTVEHKWMMDEEGQQTIAAQRTINEITDNPPDPATLSANGQCFANEEDYQAAVDAQVAELEAALDQIPADEPTRATFEAKVQAFKEAAMTPEQQVEHRTSELQARLEEKAGHPVAIAFEEGGFDTEAQLRQLDLLEQSLDDESFDGMWENYETIEFNTYEQYQNDSDESNLSKYTEVDGSTLKINNPAEDGITDAEYDKQWRALQHTRDTGEGS